MNEEKNRGERMMTHAEKNHRVMLFFTANNRRTA